MFIPEPRAEQGQRRDAVIRAALEQIGEHGFHGSPVALIAERAGVAAGTIYRFFDGKDALIREVHAVLEDELRAAIAAGYPAEAPPRERFLHIWRALARYFIASPLQFRFLEQFHNSPYGVACRRERIFRKGAGNLLTELFEEARRRRAIKDLPLPVLLGLTTGPLVSLVRDHVLGLVAVNARLLGRTAEACWDGIRR